MAQVFWTLTLALGACFSPTVPEGLLCEASIGCPGGQVCDNGICRLTSLGPGGGRGAGADNGQGDSDDVNPADPTCNSWHAAHFDPCEIPGSSDEMRLAGDHTFNTTTGRLISENGAVTTPTSTVYGGLRIWSVLSLTLSAGTTLRIVGDRPLVVAAFDRLELQNGALIDAGSRGHLESGAGANPADCAAPESPSDKLGGGGGGGFQGRGGDGGTAFGVPSSGGLGSFNAPTIPRGGCGGGLGGDADRGVVTEGGLGGGALQLSARNDILVRGGVQAGGGGGRGTRCVNGHCSGAGGGGSGGYIGLDARTIWIDGGVLAANGGAGGAGTTSVGALDGDAGQDGQLARSSAKGTHNGGDGSFGLLPNGKPGDGASLGNGSGGGGGGSGWIVFRGIWTLDNETISPPFAD